MFTTRRFAAELMVLMSSKPCQVYVMIKTTNTKSKKPAEHCTPYDSSSAPAVPPSCRQDWTITSPAGTSLSTREARYKHQQIQVTTCLGLQRHGRHCVTERAPGSMRLLHDYCNRLRLRQQTSVHQCISTSTTTTMKKSN